jgi:hypothetical protein
MIGTSRFDCLVKAHSIPVQQSLEQNSQRAMTPRRRRRPPPPPEFAAKIVEKAPNDDSEKRGCGSGARVLAQHFGIAVEQR